MPLFYGWGSTEGWEGAGQNLKKGLGYIGGRHGEVIRKVRNPVPAMTYMTFEMLPNLFFPQKLGEKL